MWYWTKLLFLILVGSVLAWLAYELLTFPSISRLRTENPTTTSMIEFRKSEAAAAGSEPKQFMIWTPMEQISPHLIFNFFNYDGRSLQAEGAACLSAYSL